MMDFKKKSINNGGMFSTLRQISNLISTAKYCNINEITVPLWNKDFLFVPSLYCNDLYNLDEVISVLSESMDISYTKANIYIKDTINNINKNDVCRYLDCYVVKIKNINKIKYFGINESKAERLEGTLLESINELYFQINDFLESSDEDFNLQNLNFENFTKREIKHSVYSFIFAYKLLKSKYTNINIESFLSKETATDNILFFKTKTNKKIFNYLLNTNCNENKKIKNQ